MVVILSLMPNPEIKNISWSSGLHIDKIAHIAIYAIYSFLIGRYLALFEMSSGMKYFLVLTLSIAIGVIMEFMQFYLSPSRFFEMLDIIANIIGSIVGLLILKIKY